jgi:hypothetical protein
MGTVADLPRSRAELLAEQLAAAAIGSSSAGASKRLG